ncbi:hypothetical protein C6501_08730 [Candidatus Poribacteria bacterium]|nr:MAG: hypothetical protein C6501_08730 [Candidatus Poribacteria bacterium]
MGVANRSPLAGLPEKYPSYQTCYRRFQQWSSDGTLERVQMTLTGMLEKQKNKYE